MTAGDSRNLDSLAHPHDTPVSSSLRFLSELIAWVAGAWAASTLTNWLVLPVLVVLVGLPAVFSTQNDKRQVVIATPGPIRVAIELLLYAVAALAPWMIWPQVVSAGCVAIVLLTIGYLRFSCAIVLGFFETCQQIDR